MIRVAGGAAPPGALTRPRLSLFALHFVRPSGYLDSGFPVLAHPSSLDTDRTRDARAPTSPRSTGFCAIWSCIFRVHLTQT